MTTNNNNCAGCGCNDTIPQPCAPAPPVCETPQPCTEILDAQCVKYTGPAITCNDVNIIPQNTSVADALNALVDLVCDGNCCAIPAVTNIEDPNFIMLCRDEVLSCVYNGLLYNWLALNTGITGDGRLSGGIVNVNPLDNIINTWRVPNDADWYALALALDPTATNVPWNNAAGGKVKSTTCWSLPNSGATNESSLSVVPSVYRNPSGSFSNNNGQIGVYWSASQVLSTTANGYSLVHIDDSIFKSSYLKGHGFRVRLVRPIDCTELNGDFIPNAYKDNSGNLYNAKVIGTLVWITEDLKDIKFNNNTNIPVATLNSAWSATTVGAYCLPDNKSNYESNYTVGCEQVKISFQNFLDAIPTGSGKLVEVKRNWGTCVTTQEITTPEEKTIYSVAIEDSGWQDLEGFDFYEDDMALRKPQIRRVGTVLHFRGDLIIPIGNNEQLIPVSSPFDLYSKIKRRTPYETLGNGSLGIGVYVDYDKKIWFNNKGDLGGPTSVIPSTVLPANINLDNNYKCSNVIGTRKLSLSDDDTQPPAFAKLKEEAKLAEKADTKAIASGKTSSVLLSTYAQIEITTDKKLRIFPLETLEVTDGDTDPFPGNSVLRALTSNFYNQAYMLGAANMDAGINAYGTEISTTYPILYDDGAGTLLTPGTYVVVSGDPSDGDWSNISDLTPYENYNSVTVTTQGLPNDWGTVELIDIRAYQRRPLLKGNKVWPPFLDSYDFFDTAKAEFMGGFVFNLDNFQAFTSIDNCYANFDGENSCQNTPLPPEDDCCQSPFLYFLNTTYTAYQNYVNEVATPLTFGEYLAETLSQGIILNGYTTMCCPDCGNKPYLLTSALQYIKYTEGLPPTNPLNPNNFENCCKQLEASPDTTSTIEESLPGFLSPCPSSNFTTCYDDLALILSPSIIEDIQKTGLLEINTINEQTTLCDLQTFLESSEGIPTLDYGNIVLLFLERGFIVQCFENGDTFMGGYESYNNYLNPPMPA
jgi:uncharacterized protein (TIGR02145 family)